MRSAAVLTKALSLHPALIAMIKVNALSYALLIKLLLEGTRTCAELAEETGLHKLTVYQYTRELHKQRAIHIAAYEYDSRGRSISKVFMIGDQPDAKRQRLTSTARTKKYRAKLKRTKEMNAWLQNHDQQPSSLLACSLAAGSCPQRM